VGKAGVPHTTFPSQKLPYQIFRHTYSPSYRFHRLRPKTQIVSNDFSHGEAKKYFWGLRVCGDFWKEKKT
jgi:hypothetical protein